MVRSALAVRSALLALLFCLPTAARADIFRPAYLELRETAQSNGVVNRYDVMWKVPTMGNSRLAVHIRFPEGTTQLTPPRGVVSQNAYVERWQISHPGGLAGQELVLEGIAGGVTDVIVRVEHLDGTSQVDRVLPDNPQFTVKGATGTGEVAWSYLVLGVEHILAGVDHLLFVLALLLIVRGGKRIIITVTAFTIAHSITLVAATVKWVQVPG